MLGQKGGKKLKERKEKKAAHAFQTRSEYTCLVMANLRSELELGINKDSDQCCFFFRGSCNRPTQNVAQRLSSFKAKISSTVLVNET